MKNWIKILLWIVIILAVFGIIGFMAARQIWSKIVFGAPQLQNINLQGLSATDIAQIALTGSQKEVKVDLAMTISNGSKISIPFSKVRIRMYYNDQLIATTSEALAQNKFKLPAGGSVTINDTTSIYLNTAGGRALLEKLKGGHPEIQYKVNISIWGIPLPIPSNSFKW